MEEDESGPGRWKIPDVTEVITGELAQRGDWVVANIETSSFWPVKAQKVRYRGAILWILPVMKNYYPAVATKVPPGKTRSECERLLMRFLSNLAWVEEKGFLVDGIGGGSVPAPMGREKEAYPADSGSSICSGCGAPDRPALLRGLSRLMMSQ